MIMNVMSISFFTLVLIMYISSFAGWPQNAESPIAIAIKVLQAAFIDLVLLSTWSMKAKETAQWKCKRCFQRGKVIITWIPNDDMPSFPPQVQLVDIHLWSMGLWITAQVNRVKPLSTSGYDLMSLQKVDSLLGLLDEREAKKFSVAINPGTIT